MKHLLFISTSLLSFNLFAATWMPKESVDKVNDLLVSYCEEASDSPMIQSEGAQYYCAKAKINVVRITKNGQTIDAKVDLDIKLNAFYKYSIPNRSTQIDGVKSYILGECRLSTPPQLAQFVDDKTPSRLKQTFKNTILECMQKTLCLVQNSCPTEE